MKVLIAIDSFKGCMSSKEAGRACAEGIWRARPRAETVVMPMADGGEGTMDAIVEGLKGEYVECRTAGPYGSEVTARYGVVNKRKAAVIEAAQATGDDSALSAALNVNRAGAEAKTTVASV